MIESLGAVTLWHIATKTDWEQAQRAGAYRAPSLDAVGFIHLSEERQWRAVAKRFFRGRRELLLLEIDSAVLKSEVRHEAADGDHFPHLYGELELTAVVKAYELQVDDQGSAHFAGQAPPVIP